MHIKSLHIYPVKGAGGVSVAESALLLHGLANDRCWVPVGADGSALLQWAHPSLAQVRVALAPDGIILSAPQMRELHVPVPGIHAPPALLKIKKRELQAQEASPAAHKWFGDFLGIDCRLLYKEDTQSGGTPVHITTTASLEDLNRRTGSDTPMDRFRPNIVIETERAWEEDAWSGLRVGGAILAVIKPCARCEVITTDQKTGARGEATPLDALKKFRIISQPGKASIAFGLNLAVAKNGVARAGDFVEILSLQDAPQFVAR